MVRPAGYNIITKENWVGSLEKAIDVPGEKLTEMKTDIDFIKDLLLQMNKKTPSVVGDHFVNKNEKPWELEEESGKTEEDEDVPLRSWVKKVELPTFEGHDPLGWLARAEKFFEVQQVKP